MTVRVLLVEDDVMISEALADEGFDVVQAGSGEEALETAETTTVDVVLLDLMLPGIDGLSVCRTLRDSGDLPVIVITARTDSSDVIAGLEAGADDYVTKPLVPGELAAQVRACSAGRLQLARHGCGSVIWNCAPKTRARTGRVSRST